MLKRLSGCFFIALAFVNDQVQGNGISIKSRTSIAAVNELRNVFSDSLIPSLVQAINNAGFNEQTDTVFIDESFGKLSGTIAVGDFKLDSSIDANKIDFQVSNVNDSETAIEVSLNNLSGSLQTLDFDLQFISTDEIVPVDCGLQLSLGQSFVSIRKINLLFHLNFLNGMLSVAPKLVGLEMFQVNIDLSFNFDHCQIFDYQLPTIIETIASNISDLVEPLVVKEANFFLSAYSTSVMINEPQFLPLVETAELEVTPQISKLGVDPSNSFFDFEGGISFFARLLGPKWRRGNAFVPFSDSTTKLPSPSSSDHLVDMDLGLNALNELLQTVWYVGWSMFATDETDTSMCEASNIDPCQFPPFKQDVGLESWLYRFIFLFDGLWFTAFQYQIVVEPPSLDIQEIDEVNVEGKVKALLVGERKVFGRKELLSVTGKVAMDIDFPAFDSTRGVLTGLELSDIDIPVVDIDFLGITRFVSWMFSSAFNSAAQNTINYVIDTFLPLNDINVNIEQTLGLFPFKIPEIPFDAIGLNVSVDLINMELGATPSLSTDEMASLRIAGDIAVSFESNAVRHLRDDKHIFLSPPQSIFDTNAYKLANLTSSKNLTTTDEIFGTTFINAKTGERETHILRVSTHSSTVEVFVDGQDWEVLSSDRLVLSSNVPKTVVVP